MAFEYAWAKRLPGVPQSPGSPHFVPPFPTVPAQQQVRLNRQRAKCRQFFSCSSSCPGCSSCICINYAPRAICKLSFIVGTPTTGDISADEEMMKRRDGDADDMALSPRRVNALFADLVANGRRRWWR